MAKEAMSGASQSVRRGQAAHLRQDPLLQALVLHVLRQGVEAVRALDRVAADELAQAVLRPGAPVLARQRARRPSRIRRDLAPALAIPRAGPPDPLPVG